MKHLLKFIPMMILLVSCSKPALITELKGEDGIAIDPNSGNPFTGEAYLNYYDGQLRMQGMYELGEKTGTWKYYIKGTKNRFYEVSFKNGQIENVNYNEDERRWEGSPIAFSPDSGMVDGKYFVQERDTYDYSMPPQVNVHLVGYVAQGALTRWFDSGQIYSDGYFLNGDRNGLFNWWYETGELKETATFTNGNRDGEVTQWFQNGKKYAEGSYEKGQLHGNLTWWYESGQKKEETHFIQGNRDGFAYWWYENGAKKGLADISGGNGVVTLFSPDGSVANKFDVKNETVFCNSGEILLTISDISKKDKIFIGDGTCDCADCSDEKN